ncbi:MAG: metallophosphoesterase [Muribaculaceae bacterium]|nr:metallophosphoesterase [Muribaculaceae bacterium]
MKIQFASDLHLEFRDNSRYLRERPLETAGDVLLLAGDIGYLGDDNYCRHPFWDWAADNYEQVVCCLGNHEFYKHYDIATLPDGYELEIRPNVRAYYNKMVNIGNVDIFVTTLWSKISLQDAFFTEQCVADFHRILYNGKRLTFSDFNREHERCMAFLYAALQQSRGARKIVLTHHVPSFLMLAPEFKGSAANGAFTVELFEFIADSDIDYWIFGHSHRNIEATIGRTRCVCNQLGYVHSGEHNSFSHSRVIEV